MSSHTEHHHGAGHGDGEPLDDLRKLRLRLSHWIEHNHSHGEEFIRGARLAAAVNRPETAQALAQAAELLGAAGLRLQAALEAMDQP